LFLNPVTGWGADADGAVRRLDARTQTRSVSQASNQLYERDSSGSWRALPTTTGLNGRERGWVWHAARTQIRGRQYLTFKGVSVVDQDVAEKLLDGLHVLDENAREVDSPIEVAHMFTLSLEEATVFAKRVAGAGGQILRASSTSEAAESAVAQIELYAYELEELAELDRDALQEARSGNIAGALADDFDSRGETFRTRLDLAAAAFAVVEREIGILMARDSGADHNAPVQAILDGARAALQRCNVLVESRAADEHALARIIAQTRGLIDDTRPSAAKILLFRELGQVAAEQGLQVNDTPDGVRIRTKYGWMRLGPAIEFE
jgi:hypothetical protein